MDQRERDEIRARLDRPHLRSALSPIVTVREVRAMLDALDAVTAERDAMREQLAAHARHTDAAVDGPQEPVAGAPVAGTGERASDSAGAPRAASSRDGGGGL